MTMNNYHIIEELQSKQRHILYGPVEEYLDEMTDLTPDDIKIINPSDWTTDEMIEITGSLLEDVNMHKCCNAPNEIQQIMQQCAIPKDMQNKFFRLYMTEMFQRYGY